MTTLSLLDLIEQDRQPVTKMRVLIGEDADAGRRGDKVAIAVSQCIYDCPDRATLVATIEHLKDSDERLRGRKEELMLWDWQSTWLTYHEPGNPDSGGLIELGVAWYDQTFFDERCGAGMEAMHRRIYQAIGIPLENISIQHFLAAEHATWLPAAVSERQLVNA